MSGKETNSTTIAKNVPVRHAPKSSIIIDKGYQTQRRTLAGNAFHACVLAAAKYFPLNHEHEV